MSIKNISNQPEDTTSSPKHIAARYGKTLQRSNTKPGLNQDLSCTTCSLGLQAYISALLLVFALVLLVTSQDAHTKDFGTAGEVFAISEKHPVELIRSRLKALRASGELTKIEEKWQKNILASANRPTAAVRSIKEAEATTTRYFDPSVTVDKDIKDHLGRIIAKKGTRINPFDHITYDKKLIFIDGDNATQVNFALKQPKSKIILVRGSITDLIKKSRTHLYFDYDGYLSKKFKISRFPSVVEQDGKMIKIVEVRL